MSRSVFSRGLLSALLALALPAVAAAQATTYTWTGLGTTNQWFDDANWSAVGPGSTPPLSSLTNTFVVLNGPNRLTNVLDYSFDANSLTFAAEAGSFVVNNPTSPPSVQTLTLGTGGLTVATNNANAQTFNANLALGAAQTWTHNGTGLLTVGGVVSGTGALTKSGAGTLVLSGANTFTGATTISTGTVLVSSAAGLGTTVGNTTVSSGAALQVTGAVIVTEPLVLNGTGVGSAGALRKVGTDATGVSGALTIASATRINADAGTLTLSGPVGGGANTLTFGGAGNTTASGVITLTAAGALAKDGAGTLTLSGGNSTTLLAPITVSGGVISYANQLSLGNAAGAGAITLDGGTLDNTNAGPNSRFIPLNRNVVLGAGGGTLNYTPAGVLSIVETGTVISGSGGLTKTGAGIVSVVTPATYTGPTTVAAGTLRVRTNSNVFPTNTALTVNTGATFDVSTLNQQVGSLAGAGTVSVGGTFTVGNATSTTFSGVIQGTSGRLTKVGSGTLTLSGANTYTGLTTVSAGTLQLAAADNRLPAASSLALTAGTLDLNGFSQSVNALTGAGTVTTTAAGPSTLTVGNGGGSGSFTGAVGNGSGTVALTKVGAGTLTLSGANTYTGATTVSAGTLAVNGSTAAGSAVGVTGATLAGAGTVGGPVTVNDTGAVRGGVTGVTTTVLTVANNVTVAANGTLRFETARTAENAATASAINLTGTTSVLNLGAGGAFALNLVNGTPGLVTGEMYTVTLATVGAAGNIQLNGDSLDPLETIPAANYTLTSSSFAGFSSSTLGVDANGTGLVLTFTPVPEPATLLAAAAGVLGLGAAVRRVRGRRATA